MDAADGAASAELEAEEEVDSLQCVVCLDILYKPIVLACGHTYCFWCVHKAMSGLLDSNCAICRQPYNHFPSICQLLHLLIRKIEPRAYKRREKEILEEETSAGIFSPQLAVEKINHNVDSSSSQERCETVHVSDVLCASCNKILFQPAVLNCGHVHCGSCMAIIVSETIVCEACLSPHPGERPKVCLDLDQFLKKHFRKEYEERKHTFQERGPQKENQASGSASTSKADKKNSVEIMDGVLSINEIPIIHFGIGCDSCGMLPITGKRYRCQDCKEAVGFDLCEQCFTSSSKLPGRFNQQHTPDHTLVRDDSKLLANLLIDIPTFPDSLLSDDDHSADQ